MSRFDCVYNASNNCGDQILMFPYPLFNSLLVCGITIVATCFSLLNGTYHVNVSIFCFECLVYQYWTHRIMMIFRTEVMYTIDKNNLRTDTLWVCVFLSTYRINWREKDIYRISANMICFLHAIEKIQKTSYSLN